MVVFISLFNNLMISLIDIYRRFGRNLWLQHQDVLSDKRREHVLTKCG